MCNREAVGTVTCIMKNADEAPQSTRGHSCKETPLCIGLLVVTLRGKRTVDSGDKRFVNESKVKRLYLETNANKNMNTRHQITSR